MRGCEEWGKELMVGHQISTFDVLGENCCLLCRALLHLALNLMNVDVEN